MTPTIEEYSNAKEITIAYENEQKRLFNLKVKSFRVDLQEYFDNNLIDGSFRLKEFELRNGYFGNGEIIPINPDIDEIYGGDNDDDIKKLCEKHGVNFSFVSWCYPK